MGVDYNESVFFGAVAVGDTEAERRLKELFADGNGDAVDVSGCNAFISRAGNAYNGNFEYSIRSERVKRLARGTSYHSGPIAAEPNAEADVVRAIDALGLDPSNFSPIGYIASLDIY